MKNNFSDVLFVGPYNPNGGIGSVITRLAGSMNGSSVFYIKSDGSAINKVFGFIFQTIRFSRYLLQQNDIVYIHFHSASNASFFRKSILFLISRLSGKKLIFHIHGGAFKEFYRKSFFTSIYIKAILKNANRVICLSEEWMQFFEKELNLKNVSVLHNPIDDYRTVSMPFRPNPLKILFLGAINKQKGIFDLLEYLKQSRIFNDFKIELHVGGVVQNHDHNRFSELINNHPRFYFHGWLDEEKKKKIFNQTHVFILPSYTEGLPVSILEAMSYSKPIIATAVGGIPSIVKEGVNGWLIDNRDLSRLESILHHLIFDPYSIHLFGANSKYISRDYYTPKAVSTLSSIYNSI